MTVHQWRAEVDLAGEGWIWPETAGSGRGRPDLGGGDGRWVAAARRERGTREEEESEREDRVWTLRERVRERASGAGGRCGAGGCGRPAPVPSGANENNKCFTHLLNFAQYIWIYLKKNGKKCMAKCLDPTRPSVECLLSAHQSKGRRPTPRRCIKPPVATAWRRRHPVPRPLHRTAAAVRHYDAGRRRRPSKSRVSLFLRE